MTVVEHRGALLDLAGEGEALVVLPGGPARHPDYLNHLGGLHRRGFRLATVFPRGVGPSPVPDDPREYAAHRRAEDVEAARDLLQAESVALVAHSAGCGIAFHYAAAHPDRLRRLVLITPGPRAVGLVDTDEEYEAQLDQQRHRPWYPSARQALDDIDAHGLTPERRAAMMPLLYGAWTPKVQAHAALDPVQTTPQARDHFHDDEPDPATVRAAMARVTCPVRIVVGEVDPGPGPVLAAEIAALFPDARVLTQPGAGHFPWVTDPTGFAAVMTAALTS